MFEWISNPEAWVALGTLTVLELILGIDNIVFISILADKLPESEREKARRTGLLLAMVMRILLLLCVGWLLRLQDALFTVFGHGVSWKDLIMITGGLFLLGKATHEIHQKLEGRDPNEAGGKRGGVSFTSIVVQILLLDIVFSVDSVLTAVGMAAGVTNAGDPDAVAGAASAGDITLMSIAVVTSVLLMLLFAGPIGRFVSRHPTVKMLALSFLLLIGMTLVADGAGFHIPKGYIYFAMGFSVFVEGLNLFARRPSSKPVKLREAYTRSAPDA